MCYAYGCQQMNLGYIKKLSPKEDTILIVNDTIDLSNVESVEYEVIE